MNNAIDTRIRMMEKIEAILNKTADRGATEAEAETALLMAQKLMAKYHIEMKELNLGKKAAKVYRKSTGCSAMAQWSIQLLNIIGQNFRCETYLMNGKASFIGQEEDSDLAVRLYKMVFDTAERGTKKIRRQYRKMGLPTPGVADSYLRGFLKGLEEALEAQKASLEKDPGMALVLAVPKEATEELEVIKNKKDTRTVHGRPMGGISDILAFGQGLDDGRTSLTKGIEN